VGGPKVGKVQSLAKQSICEIGVISKPSGEASASFAAVKPQEPSSRPGRLELLPAWAPRKKEAQHGATTGLWLMDSLEGDEDEDKDAEGLSCSIGPNSPFRVLWNVFSMVLVVYDIIVIPLLVFEFGDPPFLLFMQWITRIFWTVDLVLNFFTGFVNKSGHIERRRNKIARNYIRTWFGPDISMVLLDWMESLISLTSTRVTSLSKAARSIRIVRMVRLFRFARTSKLLTAWLESFCPDRLRILVSMFIHFVVVLIAVHVLTCLFYAVGSSGKGWAEDCRPDKAYCYLLAFRWSLALLSGNTTEIVPGNIKEQYFSAFAFLGAFFAGTMVVSTLTSLMTQFFMEGSKQDMQVNVLRRYMQQNNISKHLSLRIIQNAKYALKERQALAHEEMVDIMALLSESLRREMRYEVYCPILNVHPFFSMYMSSSPMAARRICSKAMSMMLVASGDVVFGAGELQKQPRMYILSRGALSYYQSDLYDEELPPNAWVSELALWISWRHLGTLRAMKDCRMCLLDAQEFGNIAGAAEVDLLDPRLYANSLVAYLGTLEASDFSELSDIMTRAELEAHVLPNFESSIKPSPSATQSALKRQMTKVVGRFGAPSKT